MEADPAKHEVRFSLDEGKGSVASVVEALKKAGYAVEGEPRKGTAAGNAAP